MNYVRCIQFDLLFALLGFILTTPPLLAAQSAATTNGQTFARDPDLARTRPTRFNASFAGGSGLIQAVSPDTLPSGVIVAGASVMNFDRDPADVDLFEYSFQGAIGVTSRTEFFVKVDAVDASQQRAAGTREVSRPPLDLFVDAYPTRPSAAVLISCSRRACRTKPSPRENMTETGSFSSSSGDNVFGLKVNLRSRIEGTASGSESGVS